MSAAKPRFKAALGNPWPVAGDILRCGGFGVRLRLVIYTVGNLALTVPYRPPVVGTPDNPHACTWAPNGYSTQPVTAYVRRHSGGCTPVLYMGHGSAPIGENWWYVVRPQRMDDQLQVRLAMEWFCNAGVFDSLDRSYQNG